eukprot:751669-Rhodomonas_salina.2
MDEDIGNELSALLGQLQVIVERLACGCSNAGKIVTLICSIADTKAASRRLAQSKGNLGQSRGELRGCIEIAAQPQHTGGQPSPFVLQNHVPYVCFSLASSNMGAQPIT